jgi:hypothetical protein
VRRLKQCDEDIIPQRREREEELGREVVDNCGAILAPHRTGEYCSAAQRRTRPRPLRMEWNGRRAAGGGLPRSAPGRGRMGAAALQQHRAEKAEQILYERTPPDLGFGTVLLDSVWNHQGMVAALLSQHTEGTDGIVFLALVWRWSAAAITSSRSGRIGGCVSISTSVWCVWPPLSLVCRSLSLTCGDLLALSTPSVCNHIAIIRRWRPPTVVGDSRLLVSRWVMAGTGP